jgi:NAD(P)-dependent dehydrogenase (short-subunit alcohol dehydrogenase family)
MNLQGKLVLVTGAGSGIGRATARAFAAAGARLIVTDLDGARVEAIGRELGGALHLARTVDVADRAAMKAFADEVHRTASAVDVLVNNAGVAVGGPFLDTSLEDWDWQLGVNLGGVIHGCHFFVPRMVERGGGGQVINLSSVLGLYAPAGVSAYAASKFAVRAMSQSLRAELAVHHIGVTAICPGLIATAIVEDGRMKGATGAGRDKLAHVFRSRGLPPERVAEAILGAVATNPAILPVGRDAWALYALTRVAPRTLARLGGMVARRFAG